MLVSPDRSRTKHMVREMANAPLVRHMMAVLAAGLMTTSASAQEPPVDRSGVWWYGAPVPLLPGESPEVAGMSMGRMGTSAGPLLLTEHGQALMAEFDPVDGPAVQCIQSGLVRTISSPCKLLDPCLHWKVVRIDRVDLRKNGRLIDNWHAIMIVWRLRSRGTL